MVVLFGGEELSPAAEGGGVLRGPEHEEDVALVGADGKTVNVGNGGRWEREAVEGQGGKGNVLGGGEWRDVTVWVLFPRNSRLLDSGFVEERGGARQRNRL